MANMYFKIFVQGKALAVGEHEFHDLSEELQDAIREKVEAHIVRYAPDEQVDFEGEGGYVFASRAIPSFGFRHGTYTIHVAFETLAKAKNAAKAVNGNNSLFDAFMRNMTRRKNAVPAGAPAPCPPGKIRNPKTGRCVKATGAIGKKIGKTRRARRA